MPQVQEPILEFAKEETRVDIMKKKSKLLLLFFSIPIVVAIVLAFSVFSGGSSPPSDKIGETITITATVGTQVHFARTVSDGIGVSTGE